MTPLFSPSRPNQIIALDGMRAISVLIVLAGHFNVPIGISPGFGVTIFFFISGTLITHLLLEEIETHGRLSLRNFYARRFLRLMPALMFYVFTIFALYRALGLSAPAGELLPAVFYYQNYYTLYGGGSGGQVLPYGVLWSLAIEEHYYLAYPLLLLVLGNRPRKLFFAIAGLIALATIWRTVVIVVFDNAAHAYMATDTRIDSILFGALLAIAARLKRGEKAIRLLGHPLACLAAIAVIAVHFAAPSHPFIATFRYSLLCPALFVLFAGLLFSSRYGPAHRFLETRPMRWIGVTSYPLYLWHTGWLGITSQLMGEEQEFLARLCALGLSLLAANVSYYAVERRFAVLRRRFGSHMPSASRRS